MSMETFMAPSFEELADEFGYRVVPLTSKRGTTDHYVTKDDKDRTVIGPVRHHRRRKARKAIQFERFASTEELTQHMRQQQDDQERTLLKGMKTIRLQEAFKGLLPQQPEKQKVGKVRGLWNWAVERFWDEDFHKRCQQALLTAILGVLLLGCTIIITQAVIWSLVH